MSEPTNADRAEWARQALDAFRASHGAAGHLLMDIHDLITDLLHLARREGDHGGHEFDAEAFALKAAEMHDEEVLEDIEE